MRILIWSNSYRPQIGGVEVFLSQLAPALLERGHEVGVITDRGPAGTPEEEVLEGVRVERLPFNEALHSARPAEMIRVSRRAADALGEFAPDTVHLNFSDATIFFYLRAAAAHPAPMALTFHLSPPPVLLQRQDGALHRAMEAAGHITACSQAVLDDALELAPQLRERSSVVLNGLAPPPVEPAPLPEEPLVFAAGRLVEEKGFDVLIEAMPALREQVPGARLVLAGEGQEHVVLAARARAAGLEDAVELTGWVAPERIYPLMAGAAAVAIPSRWREPFCLVALQAAIMGRATVGTRVGGLPEVVLDGETGVLVEREDPAALARELAALLQDRGRAEELGRAARARALDEFSIARCAERYEAIFRGLA